MQVIRVIVVLCLFAHMTTISFCDEGSFELCEIANYYISFDYVHEKLFLSCGGETPQVLNRIDPVTLSIEQTHQIHSLVRRTWSIDNGSKFLICLSELDGDPSTREGKLVEMDYGTGNIFRELFFTHWPVTMVVDESESYAYIALNYGRTGPQENHPRIMKISLSSFQYVTEVIYGDRIRSIKLTSDGNKLYVQTNALSLPRQPFGVAVFDTADLSIVEQIVLDYPAGYLVMSDDGSQLFISSSVHRTAPDVVEGVSLYIVDTNTDEISEEFLFEHEGELVTLRTMALDSTRNTLYAHARNHMASNLILALDLDDYSYSTFTMGDNPIGSIALAQTSNGPRLFATERGTPVVHYKDVKCLFNQDPICVLEVVTPMPYQGSLPAAITFDASNSYDPDGHEITYHWDFNGDGIFDGVGDEYTGDPWNPTHQFTSYGIHVVMLKVMDECGGECVETVVIEIVES